MPDLPGGSRWRRDSQSLSVGQALGRGNSLAPQRLIGSQIALRAALPQAYEAAVLPCGDREDQGVPCLRLMVHRQVRAIGPDATGKQQVLI